MAAPCTVLTVGEALVDIVVPPSGEPAEHVGGSPANVAIGLAALRHDCVLATHIGQDERGVRIADHLAAGGVRLAPGSSEAPRTPTATATLDGAGGASYDFDLVWEVPEVDLTAFGHLHAGSIAATLQPGAADVLRLMGQARDGATISYDPNGRPSIMGPPHEVRAQIEECIGRADVVKASVEDVEWLYAGAPVADVAHLWGRLGPELVVITRGGDGALVHHSSSDRQREVAARAVQVIDTVGAGDSFMAGLVSGLLDAELLGSAAARARLRSAGPDDPRLLAAVDRGIAAASYTVARAGAQAPGREMLEIETPGDHRLR